MTSRMDPASRVVYPEKVTNQKYEGGRLLYESLMTVTKAEINVLNP